MSTGLCAQANTTSPTQEFSDITKTPLDGITVALPDPSNLSLWHVTLAGPPNTPYERGTFGIKVNLPAEYPFKAPVVTFATRIYHPNVTNDSEGNICISLLKPENWKPASKLAQVLVALRQLLTEPNPDDPLEDRIAQEFRSDQVEFKKHVREYVERYARRANPFEGS